MLNCAVHEAWLVQQGSSCLALLQASWHHVHAHPTSYSCHTSDGVVRYINVCKILLQLRGAACSLVRSADAVLHGQQPAAACPCKQQELSACAPPTQQQIIGTETYAMFPLINALLRAAAVLLSTMLLCSVCCTSRHLTSAPASATQGTVTPLDEPRISKPFAYSVLHSTAASAALHNPGSTFQCNTAVLENTDALPDACIFNRLTTVPTRQHQHQGTCCC